MKVGIVTYFNIKNYGSVLQAFSSKNILEQLGHQSVFLDIREHKKTFKLLHKFHVASVTILKCAVSKTSRKIHREIRSLRKESGSGFGNKTNALFDEFIAKQLYSISIDRMTLKKKAHTDEFGAFICGSDQIWSPLSIHLSGYKYLNFAPKNKRIAYAPSFGVSAVPSYNIKFVAKQLKGIRYLSVRETEGAKIIKNLTTKEVPVLLDPTMLIDGNVWRELYNSYEDKNVLTSLPDKYVLCYFFDEPSDDICEKISSYANEVNAKMVVLSTNNNKLLSKGAIYVDAGPWEFLHIIDNSESVFTNSFHGSVFSLQFSKPLLTLGRNHSDTVKQTSRIDTLLKNTELESCRYISGDIQFTDTSKALDKLLPYREKSIDFLRVSLKKVAENE